MNIREFAEHTGLTAHTLRYYERVGLMGSVGREANGHRVYGPQDSQWVTFLHHLRETGMSIREMQRYCAPCREGGGAIARPARTPCTIARHHHGLPVEGGAAGRAPAGSGGYGRTTSSSRSSPPSLIATIACSRTFGLA